MKSRSTHLALTVIWAVILVAASAGAILQATGHKVSPLLWLLSVAFISLCSIYANMVGHWSAYQATQKDKDK